MLNKNDRVIITSECQTKGYTGSVNKVFYCGDNLCASVRLDKLPPSEMKFQSYNVCNLELVDKEFTKADLKPCMVVRLRRGVLTMTYDTQDGINFNTETNGYINLKSLNEKLIEKHGIDNSEFDVVEIYGLYKYAQGVNCSKISIKDRPLIWKREEEPIKSPTQLEIESIELEQRKLADRLAKLKENV